MGDEDDLREFIKSNLTELSKSTVIGTSVVLLLYERGLINVEETHNFNNTNFPEITRAMTLYTTSANKWDPNQFEEFKNILKETGNCRALQVFTNAGADYFLTNEQVQLLRQHEDKSEDGCYEGLSLEEETTANKIVQFVRSDQMFKEGKFKLSEGVQRREVIRLVRQFHESLKNKSIWWNPRKPQLPPYYIERKVARTYLFISDGTLPSPVQPKTLLEVTENIVLLVDPPGMGKSSEVTNLEQQLRTKLSNNRVIVRTNLNEAQGALSTINETDSAPIVVRKLASFLPSKALLTSGVRLVLLLDGLDEVCPKHTDTMINLLRILISSNDFCDLTVVLTSRPHMKEPFQAKFQLISWSLLPLTEEQQDDYMKTLGVPNEQLFRIRSTLTRSFAELLNNPIMLFMLTDLLKSNGNISLADINIYDLYSRFVDAKHERHCVEKLRMEAKSNYTDIVRDSLLNKNLPFYHHVALELLCTNGNVHLPAYIKSMGGEVMELPQATTESLVTTELLSYGLLIEDQKKRAVFKHRSFAEFFYARFLTKEQSLPQVVRDTLFGNIYAGYRTLENVEEFVVAALSSRHNGTLLPLNITTRFMITEKRLYERCDMLKRFLEGKLFSLCPQEVLLTFVNGHPDDLREAIRVLVDCDSRGTFAKLFEWMSKNQEWSRSELFRISKDHEAASFFPPAARLMVAIAINFEGQQLLSEEEVGVAIRSPYNKLIYIVASSPIEGKWDFVENHLEEGQLRKLFLMADDEDFQRIVQDRKTSWKLVANLTQEEIFSRLTKEETRVSDIVGRNPAQVLNFLGVNYVSGLAEFRVKFGDAKGKSVFELSFLGCEFALEILWGDLLKEKNDSNWNGPVREALREGLGRSSTDLLLKLRNAVRRRRKCPCANQTDFNRISIEWEESDGVIEWIFRGAPFWESSISFPPEFLIFAVLYSRNPKLVVSILHSPEFILSHHLFLMGALRSLIICTYCEEEESPNFSQLVDFLRENLHQNKIPVKLNFVVSVFVDASWEELKEAKPAFPHKHLPPFDISVGEVFIRLVKLSDIGNVEDDTLGELLGDVISFTGCRELHAVLEGLTRKLRNNDRLEMILKKGSVIRQWRQRFSARSRKEKEVDICRLGHLLAFYFSVFGFNLEWMKDAWSYEPNEWELVRELPVEISTALDSNPIWAHLLPRVKHILRTSVMPQVQSRGGILAYFPYRTEGDWERLLRLIGGVDGLIPEFAVRMTIPCYKAAPLIRAFVRMLGVEAAKDKVSHLWSGIYPDLSSIDESLGSLGSFLHSAIELGELAEVEKRAWPSLLTLRNPQAKNSLQVATETWGEDHPITLLLHKLTLSRQSSQVMD